MVEGRDPRTVIAYDPKCGVLSVFDLKKQTQGNSELWREWIKIFFWKTFGSMVKGQISLDVSEVIIACLGYFLNINQCVALIWLVIESHLNAWGLKTMGTRDLWQDVLIDPVWKV